MTRYIALYSLLILSVLSNYLPAENQESVDMSNLETAPSSIVDGVNVITGAFSLTETDLVIEASRPHVLQRSYCTHDTTVGHVGFGWSFPYHTYLFSMDKKKDANKKRRRLALSNGKATELEFFDRNDEKHGVHRYTLSDKMFKRGVVNNSSGEISAHTNMRQTFIEAGTDSPDSKTLVSGSNKRMFYKRYPGISDLYVLNYIDMPNQTRISYDLTNQEGEDLPLVRREYMMTKNLGCISWLNFNYYDSGSFFVVSHDKRTVSYHLHKKKETLLLVTKSHGQRIEYTYKETTLKKEKHIPLLCKRVCGDSYLDIDYFVKGANDMGYVTIHCKDKAEPLGRVKFLKAPLGHDEKPIVKYAFHYTTSEIKDDDGEKVCGAGSTIVYNAVGQRTNYFYNDDQRLTQIEHRFADDRPMAQQQLFWGEGPLKSFLISRTLENEQRWIQYCKYYEYNLHNGYTDCNVAREHLLGNLTGDNVHPIVLSSAGIPDNNGCEDYVKSYSFTNDYYHRINKESDGLITTLYSYLYSPHDKTDTDLVSSKIKIANGVPFERQFFFYDANYNLYRLVIDDGTTHVFDDLTGVTERREKYYYSYDNGKNFQEFDYHYDLQTGQKILDRRVCNKFNAFARMVEQEVYDANNQLAYTLKWDYDDRGNLKYESDALGQEITRQFDKNDNCFMECYRGITKEMKYDFSNRLIREEETHPDGIKRVVTHTYNLLGNRETTTDAFGQVTTYGYDEFSRLCSVTHPEVLNAEGIPYQPSETSSYDSFSRVCDVIDPLKGKTHYEYTVRNQPCYVHYPDGTHECKRYSLEGHLVAQRNRDGVWIYYTIDHLGRPLEEKAYGADPAKTLLYTRSSTYNTFHKLSETDAMGITTTYDYYPNGHLKAEHCHDKHIAYTYDSLQRLHKKIEYSGDDAIVRVTEYDLLDRISEERLEDLAGNVQKKVQYGYDQAGNKVQTTTHTDAGIAIETKHYNSRNELIKTTDAENNQTIVVIDYNFFNERGQNVLYRETIDPKGIITAEQCDAMKRLEKTERRSTFQVLQRQHFRYDAAGNLVYRQDDRLMPEEKEPVLITWTYDQCNRLTDLYDAALSESTRHTHYEYNNVGQLAETHKPDGTILFHTYDLAGRVGGLRSSDDTIHYTYAYNNSNQLLESKDLLTGQFTRRTYDQNGRLETEKLANGHTVGYGYDQAGRPISYTLPDGSSVSYRYQGALLKSVERRNASGSIAYIHTYDTHDLTGRVIGETLIGQAGTRHTTTDLKGRTRSIQTNAWQLAEATYDETGNVIAKTIQDSNGVIASTYEYDGTEQLTLETGAAQHTYVNDSRYNRCGKDNVEHTLNALNQLLDDGQRTYTYDLAGRLTTDGSATFTYDALDRLLSYTQNNATTQYTYDAQGRRMSKGEDKFLYQGDHEVGRLTAAGAMAEFRVLGIGLAADISAAVAIELQGTPYAPLHDSHGNVVCLVATSGQLYETYRYGAFEQTNALQASPWRLSSKRVDAESGLVLFGKRYYSPTTGRWITLDPSGYQSGPNLYSYVNNSPLVHYDAMGLTAIRHEYYDYDPNYQYPAVPRTREKFMETPPMWQCVGSITTWLGHNLCPFPIIKDIIKIGGMIISGDSVKGYEPDWRQHSTIIHVRGYNPSPHGHIAIPVNGMCNTKEDAIAWAMHRCDNSGGWNVDGVYNAGHGLLMDGLESAYQWFGGTTNADNVLREYFREDAANPNRKGLRFIDAHSQGSIMTSNAAADNPEYFSKYAVVTFYGAPLIGDSNNFHSMRAYRAPCDAICYFGTIGYIREKERGNVEDLAGLGSIPSRHGMASPTYDKAFQNRCREIKKNYQ